MCLEGKQERDREDRKVTGSWGLYLNTCISSGEFCTSSWRRRQRRQALSSCCSWASWGASCLEHRRTNTHAHQSVHIPTHLKHFFSLFVCGLLHQGRKSCRIKSHCQFLPIFGIHPENPGGSSSQLICRKSTPYDFPLPHHC